MMKYDRRSFKFGNENGSLGRVELWIFTNHKYAADDFENI